VLEISVKDARKKLSMLLDKVEHGDEIVITRRGKRVARLVTPVRNAKLPELISFRRQLKVSGASMSETVINNRKSERY
jgi:prevent-host-death family protein